MTTTTRKAFVACLLSVGTLATAANADILNFRDWLDANPATPNSTANEWYGTRGINGPMLSESSGYWLSPGFPNNTPLIGLRTEIGSDNGAAGPATFAGSWAHPGSGIEAVLVFQPTSPTWIGAVGVQSELIANGLTGNGVTISAYATLSGVTSSLGTITLTGTDDRTDLFNLPNLTLFQPTDRVHIAIGDNGSYLFDHVNFNAWITIPAPGATALLAGLGLLARRRR